MSSFKKSRILVLNVHRKDPSTMNDFADFNARMLIKNFGGGGSVYYFSESVVDKGLERTREEIRRIIEQEEVGVVFFAPNGDSFELEIEFFLDLKRRYGVANVLWVLDDELIFDVLTRYYAQAFDAAVTVDWFAVYGYRKLGVPALFYYSSYLKEDFHPVPVDKDIDVSFVGDLTKADRAEYVDFLRDAGVRVEVFGDGSPGGFIEKTRMKTIYSRTKVNLNFTKVDRTSAKAWFLEDNALAARARQNKGRPMEVSLSGGFCLTEYTPSIGEVFEVGEEIDVFRDKQELLDKVKYYLENYSTRERMAGRAHLKAATVYEADVFFPGLVQRLDEAIRRRAPVDTAGEVCKDRAFKKNHLTRLVILMYAQLLKARPGAALETFRGLFRYGPGLFLRALMRGTGIAGSSAHAKARKRYGKKGKKTEAALHSVDNAPVSGRGGG